MNIKQQFIEYFKTLSINEMDNIRAELAEIRHDKFHNDYEVVEIVTYDGNISEFVWNDYGFSAYHRPGSVVGSIGTNVISIPKSVYTDELKMELFAKYNNLNVNF